MSNPRSDRPEFREWLDRQHSLGEPQLPLVHTAKALIAKDIVREHAVRANVCEVFREPLAYFFYGRPAYRPKSDSVINSNAACPVCFVFKPDIIADAHRVFPFDTGAYNARLYKHSLMDEIRMEDFEIGGDSSRIDKLVSRIFGSNDSYYDGDSSHLRRNVLDAEPDEYIAQAYIDLITSRGRNEPDDRVASIEVQLRSNVSLDKLIAVIVPDNIWGDYKASWLSDLVSRGVDIVPYHYIMGREPGHYRDAIEVQLRSYLRERSLI